MRHLLGFQTFRPLGFFEADQHEVVAHQQRALDQHPVCRKELQHLVLAHGGELILQRHGLIDETAGVTELSEGIYFTIG